MMYIQKRCKKFKTLVLASYVYVDCICFFDFFEASATGSATGIGGTGIGGTTSDPSSCKYYVQKKIKLSIFIKSVSVSLTSK